MILSPAEIKPARLKRGWTQHDLSVASGVRIAVISRAEHGEAVGSDKLEKLTDALQKARGDAEATI